MMAHNAPMSMVNPSTDALMKKIDSRYSLVVLAARRARQILAKSPVRSTRERSVKDVTNALEEILEGKIRYVPGIIETEETAEEATEEVAEGIDREAAEETASAQYDNYDVVGAKSGDEDLSSQSDDDYSDFLIDARGKSKK